MHPCYHKQNFTKILLLTTSYKPPRRAVKREEVSVLQVEALIPPMLNTLEQELLFNSSDTLVTCVPYHALAKDKNTRAPSVAIPPGVLACL